MAAQLTELRGSRNAPPAERFVAAPEPGRDARRPPARPSPSVPRRSRGAARDGRPRGRGQPRRASIRLSGERVGTIVVNVRPARSMRARYSLDVRSRPPW